MLLAREFGWTLDEMRQLYRSELTTILKELDRQKTIDEYTEQRNRWAFLAAVISNGFSGIAKMLSGKKGKQKQITPDDFISKDFKKRVKAIIPEITAQKNTIQKSKFDQSIKDAKQKGLKGPW